MTDLASKLRQSYHLSGVGTDHILRRAADELERLAAERDELNEVRRAIGGDAYWMDPPDGGSVTLAEMVARANEAGRAADRLGSALALIRDIAAGSTTANSLPHIAKIAAQALGDAIDALAGKEPTA